MKGIPKKLESAFCDALRQQGCDAGKHREWLKWLRYYLDFCGKYRHGPREEESLQPFLHKLGSKGQDGHSQAEAAKSIKLFYKVIARFPRPEERRGGSGDSHAAWRECFEKLTGVIKVRQYSPRTLEAYRTWIRHFRGYVGPKGPREVDSEDAVQFLTYLAVEREVVASTQNQAFSALLFFFRHVLEKPFEVGKKAVRARRRRYIPVVLSRPELDRLMTEICPPYRLVAQVLYGCGLRLAEGLNLRIHCFNIDDGILTVHDGKGGKDRTLPLPQTLLPELIEQRERVRALHEEDLKDNYAGAFMPRGSERKWNSRGAGGVIGRAEPG